MEDYEYNLPDDVTEEIPIRKVNIIPVDDHHDFPDFKLFENIDIISTEA